MELVAFETRSWPTRWFMAEPHDRLAQGEPFIAALIEAQLSGAPMPARRLVELSRLPSSLFPLGCAPGPSVPDLDVPRTWREARLAG